MGARNPIYVEPGFIISTSPFCGGQIFIITSASAYRDCAFATIVAPACSYSESEKKAAALDGLTYIKGDAVSLEEGKVYVVEFWATWCPPCKVSVPHLTEIQKQFKDKGVTVIGISNEKNLDTVKSFVASQGEKMNYTVAVDIEGKAVDGYMAAFKQNGIPTAFVVNGRGNIAWVGHPMDGLDEALKQATD